MGEAPRTTSARRPDVRLAGTERFWTPCRTFLDPVSLTPNVTTENHKMRVAAPSLRHQHDVCAHSPRRIHCGHSFCAVPGRPGTRWVSGARSLQGAVCSHGGPRLLPAPAQTGPRPREPRTLCEPCTVRPRGSCRTPAQGGAEVRCLRVCGFRPGPQGWTGKRSCDRRWWEKLLQNRPCGWARWPGGRSGTAARAAAQRAADT